MKREIRREDRADRAALRSSPGVANFARRVVITSGEPAGVGPDLIVRVAQRTWPMELVACADPVLLQERAEQLELPLILRPYQSEHPTFAGEAGQIMLLPVRAPEKIITGKLNPRNSSYVISTLERSCEGCLRGEFAALITGPVHKGVINDDGITFTGHTEYLARYSNRGRTVMLMVNDDLRVALATTHVPLSRVSASVTAESLREVISLLAEGLEQNFGISRPRVYVCGLNPHAGEGGHIGREEIETISPVLEQMRSEGHDLVGPLPADTLFQARHLTFADAVLAMYHDQGLTAVKSRGLGTSINITLGLPFIRTSVGHGTALELAGTNRVEIDGINAVLNFTINLVSRGFSG